MNRFVFRFLVLSLPFYLFAQLDQLHGDEAEIKRGTFAANSFATTFYNDGTIGTYQRNVGNIWGEWPKGSGHCYLSAGVLFVGSEIIDANDTPQHIFSETRGYGGSTSSGDKGPFDEWWTFLPLPGFTNPDTTLVAMSKWPLSWPSQWPDKMNDGNDPGWSGCWNGWHGKNQCIEGEECYFVIDDYQNKEFMFYPDSTDLTRGGLGMRIYVRGIQWEDKLVDDAIVFRYHLKNIGTYHHDKMVIGYNISNNLGDTYNNWDANDDCGAYDQEENIIYLWDFDNTGAADWGVDSVGYFGNIILEGASDAFDGIDNDRDGAEGPGKVIDEAMFEPFFLTVGSYIVLINYNTYARTVMTMPVEGIVVEHPRGNLSYMPGDTLREIERNMIDDNLNGLIDENNGITFGEPPVTTYQYIGAKYINYFTGEGMDNLLIDERQDDGIDNDQDWDPVSDDLGADGAAGTMDTGEGDGFPTPGEPNFDLMDPDESDLLGITSAKLYVWVDMPYFDDEAVWNNLIPGQFDFSLQNQNIELIYGSGYFPMMPGQNQVYANAIILGIDLEDLITNKINVVNHYNAAYSPVSINNNDNLAVLPCEFKLSRNYPNPFNPVTTISYRIPYKTKVTVAVYNVLGQKIKIIVDEIKDKGEYQLSWHASDFASGVYFFRMQADNKVVTRKAILIK